MNIVDVMYDGSVFYFILTNKKLFNVVPVGMWVTRERYPSYPQAIR